MSVPTSEVAYLFNQTEFSTAFSFGKEYDKSELEVKASPRSGVLGPREEKPVAVSFNVDVKRLCCSLLFLGWRDDEKQKIYAAHFKLNQQAGA